MSLKIYRSKITLGDCILEGYKRGIALALRGGFEEIGMKITEIPEARRKGNYLVTLIQAYSDTMRSQVQEDLFPELISGCRDCVTFHPERLNQCYIKTDGGYKFRIK